MAGDIGIIGGLFVLVLVVVVWWTGRDRRFRRIRFGVFLERERFNDEEASETPQEGRSEPPRAPRG